MRDEVRLAMLEHATAPFWMEFRGLEVGLAVGLEMGLGMRREAGSGGAGWRRGVRLGREGRDGPGGFFGRAQ